MTKRTEPYFTGGFCLVCTHMAVFDECKHDHSRKIIANIWPPNNNLQNPFYHEVDCSYMNDIRCEQNEL